VAETIKQRASGQFEATYRKTGRAVDIGTLQINQARRVFGPRTPEISPDLRFGFDLVTGTLDAETARQEARRCLQCDLICNICTTVCPNRANIAYTMAPVEFNLQRAVRSGDGVRIENAGREHISQKFQIINLGDFCNECGNCTTFCPTDGAPFRIKHSFYLSPDSFSDESEGYMFENGKLKARVNGELEILFRQADKLIYETREVRAQLDPKTYEVEEITFSDNAADSVDLSHAPRMGVLFAALRDHYLFEE
jgi:putative selenate reductase